MKFLIDEDLPRSTTELIRRFGHEAQDVRDVGLRGAPDPKIATYAKKHGFCLVTGDFGFANILDYPPAEYAGLVILVIPPDGTAQTILKLVESFFKQSKIIANLKGKLAMVQFGSVRIRS